MPKHSRAPYLDLWRNAVNYLDDGCPVPMAILALPSINPQGILVRNDGYIVDKLHPGQSRMRNLNSTVQNGYLDDSSGCVSDCGGEQKALSFELRATTSLARVLRSHGHQARLNKAAAVVNPVYWAFGKGLQSPD
jgi:hypothetical protein